MKRVTVKGYHLRWEKGNDPVGTMKNSMRNKENQGLVENRSSLSIKRLRYKRWEALDFISIKFLASLPCFSLTNSQWSSGCFMRVSHTSNCNSVNFLFIYCLSSIYYTTQAKFFFFSLSFVSIFFNSPESFLTYS